MTSKIFFCLLLITAPLCAVPDKMEEAIKNIDTDSLNKLLIPGFILRESDKKRYVAMARSVTNKTYEELYSISFMDIGRLVRGTIKGSIGLAGCTALYVLHHGKITLTIPGKLNGDFLLHDTNRYALYSVLGAASFYFLCRGAKEFSGIVNNKYRIVRHRDALVNEAVLQRLPVCEAGTSESFLL